VLAAKRLEGDQAIERALQLADVVELETADFVDHTGAEPHAALLALGLEDRHARLEIRRADVDDQSAGEARDQPFVHVGDFGRRPIARHDDLPSVARQRVEDAQELALRLLSRGEKLDVVDEQDADAEVARLERFGRSVADRRVQLADELVERDRGDGKRRPALRDVVADRAHEVRLAEPRPAVNEERVVGGARRLGHGVRGRHGQPV